MVATTLKGSFHKKGPSIITYREYSEFNNISFREMLGKELSSNSAMKQNFNIFDSTIMKILNRQAPLKKIILERMTGLL